MAHRETDRARARLRRWLVLFFLALALPGGALVDWAYDQLKWQSFRHQQILAQDLADGVDRRLAELVRIEQGRPPEDYGFLLDPGDPGRPEGRRSPLASFPPGSRIPGLVGWFQVGEDGRFSTPWVPDPGLPPARLGMDPAEISQRQAAAHRIESVLIGNRLADTGAPGGEETLADAPLREAGPASAPAPERVRSPWAHADRAKSGADQAPGTRLSQAAFERLATQPPSPGWGARGPQTQGQTGGPAPVPGPAPRDQTQAPMPSTPETAPAAVARSGSESGLDWGSAQGSGRRAPSADHPGDPVLLFHAAQEPMRLGRLDTGHLVLFRRALIGGEQVIQGLLLELAPFLDGLIGEPFALSPLAGTADLIIAHRGEPVRTLSAGEAKGAEVAPDGRGFRAQGLAAGLLLRTRPQEPFGALELIFGIRRLPVPPGASAIGAIAAALALVLLGGTWLLWRLGARQIALTAQQQAFVSAVSHELKTPLTSIRLYAEMLNAGYADEDRRATYYRYIQEESERLSRLIANVLQLSRMGRGEPRVSVRPLEVRELMDLVGDRVKATAERLGFRLDLQCPEQGRVQADPDAFLQVLINLVDNALKFAAHSEPKLIEIHCERLDPGWWRFRVRDYGPGVPKSHRRQVFRLFYRGAEAIEQAIPGTGIGLALVEGLTLAMGGRVTLVNREPGAELHVDLPSAHGA